MPLIGNGETASGVETRRGPIFVQGHRMLSITMARTSARPNYVEWPSFIMLHNSYTCLLHLILTIISISYRFLHFVKLKKIHNLKIVRSALGKLIIIIGKSWLVVGEPAVDSEQR